ncbi:MAG TPA: ATP phosphoribosyltransferase regulatory subunit [Symbiobacteriaceae bacterium]|nr:ATP phosphoribosyltransferase regulatory subunit [Symbiobacteriaceae bacterium]
MREPMRGAIPEGVRDRLPREARLQRWLSGRLSDTFLQWGYREVITPTFEFVEGVLAGAGVLGRREDLYQLFDRRGATLALRPDMTTPIARLVGTRMASEPLPLRLAYVAPVFRYPRVRAGGAHEVWQAGVELIGSESALADAEVVALACQSLTAAGLGGFKLGLGHVAFLAGLFEWAGLAELVVRELKAALVARDLVGYERRLRGAGLDAQTEAVLLALPTFRGDLAAAVAQFGGLGAPSVEKALQDLGQVMALLEAAGLAGSVALDLSLCHALDYYTGLIFEGHLPGLGAPVLTGGRYDALLTEWGGPPSATSGAQTPAELNSQCPQSLGTGFALELDRVLEALERQGKLPTLAGPAVVLACEPGKEIQVMQEATRLRAQGLSVEIDLGGRSGEELAAYARQREAGRVAYPGANAPTETEATEQGRPTGRPTVESIH